MKSLFLSALVLCAAPHAGADPAVWQITKGEVRIMCPMTVGGSFEAVTHSLTGSISESHKPDPLGGTIEVDVRSLDTGITLRDDHMRDTYLEVGRGEAFVKALLSEIRVGEVDPRTFEGQTPFTGMLALHGVKHAVAGRLRVHREGAAVNVEANFPLKLSDYGIATPQYLGVGVKTELQVKVLLAASPEHATSAGAR